MICDSTTTVAAEAGGVENGRVSLAERIARWTAGKNRLDTPIGGLNLHRWEHPTEPTSYMLAPSICLIGQGRKRLFLGEDTFTYDAYRFLVTSVDLPVVTQIIEASSDKPYLGLTMQLDLRMIAQLILDNDMASIPTSKERLGIAVSKVSMPLLDAFNRLLDLLDKPQDIHALAPLIRRKFFIACL